MGSTRRGVLGAAALMALGVSAHGEAAPVEAEGEFGFADYLAIQNLLATYTYRVDRYDGRAVPGLFREGPSASSRAIVYPDTGTLKTHHVTSNIHIVPAGPGRASGQAYFTVFQATADFPLQCIVCGVYHDRFAKVRGVWGFVERHYQYVLAGDLTRHGRQVPPPGVLPPEMTLRGIAPFQP